MRSFSLLGYDVKRFVILVIDFSIFVRHIDIVGQGLTVELDILNFGTFRRVVISTVFVEKFRYIFIADFNAFLGGCEVKGHGVHSSRLTGQRAKRFGLLLQSETGANNAIAELIDRSVIAKILFKCRHTHTRASKRQLIGFPVELTINLKVRQLADGATQGFVTYRKLVRSDIAIEYPLGYQLFECLRTQYFIRTKPLWQIAPEHASQLLALLVDGTFEFIAGNFLAIDMSDWRR